MIRTLCKPTILTIYITILMLLILGCSSTSTLGVSKDIDENEFKKMEQLNVLAEQFYNHVNEGKLEQAREDVIALNENVTEIRFQGAASPEGVKALMETIIAAKQILNGVQPAHQEGVIAAAKVRLAVDALTHPKNPMWLHYYKILKEDGNLLTESVEANQQKQIIHSIEQLMHHYHIIRPAVLINRTPSEVEKMESYLKLLQKDPKRALDQLDVMLGELFHRKAFTAYLQLEEQEQNPLFWVTVLGAIIISILTYVGWRKYQY